MSERTGRTERPLAANVRRRACTNCTVGKAKCTPLSPDECERCNRLGKDCRYSSLATTRKRPQPNSRLQALERKVKELAANQDFPIRQSQGSFPTNANGNFLLPGPSPPPASSMIPTSFRLPGSASSQDYSIGVVNADRGIKDIIDRGIVTQELACLLLDRFRTNAVQQFPFVVIPADIPLEAVRIRTPFLFLAIMAAMVFDNPFLQHQLGEEVRQQAIQRILVGNEKSLDILQGLLIYTAWYCHFYRADRHQEFLLSQLCVTLVHELGMDKSKKRQNERLQQCKLVILDTESDSSLENAQMRAYLGTYCVSCLVASILRRRTALPYTKYMEICARSLADRAEYHTDKLIPHLVRTQELSQRIVDTFSYNDVSHGDIRGDSLIKMTSEAFIRDVDRLQAEVPSELQNNTLLELEFQILRVRINEAAIHSELWFHPDDSKPGSEPKFPSVWRSRMLWHSLNSCKDFIHTFVSHEPQELFYLTAFVFPTLCYVFILLARLASIDIHSGDLHRSHQGDVSEIQSHWSAVTLEKEAEFQELGNKVLEKFRAVATGFVGSDGQQDTMSNFASAMNILLIGYEEQRNEKMRTLQNAQVPASGMAISSEDADTLANGASSSAQGVENRDDTDGLDVTFPFAWDVSTNTVWDDMLENFTMIPFS